jgi:hypothetical protein
VKSTVYLVMTVTMNRRKVDGPVVRAIAIEMMTFDQVIRLEKEPTGLAAPLLFLQQRRKSPRHARVASPSCRPVAPVPIIGAGTASHFSVSNDRHAKVPIQGQAISVPEFPAFAGCDSPVSRDGPPSTLTRMPKECPSSELLIESVVEQMKSLRAHYRPIVIGPARDHWVEYPHEICLLGCLRMADDLREPCPVAFDGLLA